MQPERCRADLVTAEWAERYEPRVDDYRFPKGEEVREEWAGQVGRDGFFLLEAVYGPAAPGWLREIEAVQVLRKAWVQQYHRDGDRYLAALATDKQVTATRLIAPSLPTRPVIADRWLLSELAFFAVKHDRPPKDTYAALTKRLDVVPDLTVVLDVTPEAAMERAAARSGDATRPDWDVLDVQAKVREVYRSVTDASAAFPALGPVVRINAAQDRAVVLHTAWQALDQYGLLANLSGAAR
ncbi:hypothetical protein ACFYWN_41060 [Streptomyces sp. NPDC002917]|uniref:hypothetical protein n=1 Tax=Streptomyces sp. NPDC002917 TaxID=3364671 RepID=UPI0036AF17E1